MTTENDTPAARKRARSAAGSGGVKTRGDASAQRKSATTKSPGRSTAKPAAKAAAEAAAKSAAQSARAASRVRSTDRPATTARLRTKGAKAERRATRQRQRDEAPMDSTTPPQDTPDEQARIAPVPDSPMPEATPTPGTGTSPHPAIFAAGPVDLLSVEEERLFSRTTRWSFVLMVLLPMLVACAYLFTTAADRFAVEVKFAVRSPTGLPSSDLIGMVTGGAAGTTRSDAYMVVEYLQSRQFLDEVSTRLDLPAIYATDLADPLMRLAPDASKEDQVGYLARVIHPSYDATTEIVTVEAQAFTQNDALRVATAVLDTAEAMVNRLSEQARSDTVRLAEAELARAEAALKAQRAAIAAFRETEQSIDPNQTVATQENVLRDLQSQLATARAEMRSLREFLSPEAPSIRVLASRIASIENQIAQERANLGRGRDPGAEVPATGAETLNSAVSLYEALAVDLEFHERTYVSALSSLEAARLEADRQQRYLAAVVLPSLPESPAYPRVFLTLALIFAICFFSWGILSMFVHVIREHMR